MRILVTGGVGFIGSHLCRRLLNMGYEVIALDNLYTGSEKNVQDLISSKNFKILNHDVTIPIFIEVNAILNLACPASPVHYQKNPVQTTRTNVLGAINMLDLAKQLEVPILQASTSEIYGDPKESPQKESYLGNVNPIGIRACYDEGKRVAETLFFDYMRQFDLQIKVARIFNTYGPSMQFNDGRVVSNFIFQALKNENITIYGDGSQTRSFCFVTDLVSGLISFLLSDKEITGPINLGNPTETPILNLAENIIEYTNSKSRIIQLPLPLDDPKQRKPDISKAKKMLNWQPVVSLETGLKATISDMSSRF